jgi:hypothetical protein
MLCYESIINGPAWDEVGHFAAGLQHWKHFEFEFFSVNPPLVRMVATLPIVASGVEVDIDHLPLIRGPGQRPEFAAGGAVAHLLWHDYFSYLAISRMTCVLFGLRKRPAKHIFARGRDFVTM